MLSFTNLIHDIKKALEILYSVKMHVINIDFAS